VRAAITDTRAGRRHQASHPNASVSATSSTSTGMPPYQHGRIIGAHTVILMAKLIVGRFTL
jgi:hypothetical protein